MPPTLDELTIADDADAWRKVGFTIDPDGVARVGTVRLRFSGADEGDDAPDAATSTRPCRGMWRWSLRDADLGARSDVDGIPTTASMVPPAEPAQHSNGVTHIDHLVVRSSHGSSTVTALESLGLDVRRVRDVDNAQPPFRQTFFRMGEVIIELVAPTEPRADGVTQLWGLAFAVADLDATAAQLGDHVTPPKEAVQTGRRIATLRTRDLDISTAIAFMSP